MSQVESPYKTIYSS